MDSFFASAGLVARQSRTHLSWPASFHVIISGGLPQLEKRYALLEIRNISLRSAVDETTIIGARTIVFNSRNYTEHILQIICHTCSSGSGHILLYVPSPARTARCLKHS